MRKYNFKSIVAALVCACSVAFQAKAQTNITSIGSSVISLTSITDATTGATYNNTPPFIVSGGTVVNFHLSGTISDMSLLASLTGNGTITIPIAIAGASGTLADAHFPTLGLGFNGSVTNPNSTPANQVVFNVTYSNNTIILTPTAYALTMKGAFSFNLSGQAGLNSNGNTMQQNTGMTTVYTVGKSTYTLGNQPYQMTIMKNCNTLTAQSSYTTPVGSGVALIGYQIFCLYNQMLNLPAGSLLPTNSALTSDVITATTLVPQGNAQILSVDWYKSTSNDEIDYVAPGKDSMSQTILQTNTSAAYSNGDPTALKPGQHAIVNNGDGTYTVYIDWGPLVGSYDQYASGTNISGSDAWSQTAVTAAIANHLSAVDVRQYVTITYLDPSIPDTALATTTSSNAYISTTSSAKIGANNVTNNTAGQSLIKINYVDLSGNSIAQIVPNYDWAADNTQNPPASLTIPQPPATIPYNGVTYKLVTDAATLATATGIPTSAIQTSGGNTIPYPPLATGSGETDVYFVYEVSNDLPITGLQLTAQPQANNDVILTWGTLTEINSQSFTVQRSSDGGKTWVTIGTQPTQAANGNSSVPLTYQITDPTVPIGSYEYRVVETDIDGATTTSNVVQISITGGKQVYPNPASTLLNVKLPASANNVSYRLISADGKIVLKGTITNTGNYGQISVAGIASDIYFLQITVNNAMQTYEVRIQH